MLKAEDAVTRNGVLAGEDIENGRVKSPPGFRNFAISNEALVKDEARFNAVGPLTLIIEGVGGCENAGAGDDFARRSAEDGIEFAFFGFEVVLSVVGVEDVAGGIVDEVNVAPSVCPSGVFVEIDFIGGDGHFRGANLGGTFQIFPLTLGILSDSSLPYFSLRRGVGFGKCMNGILRIAGKRKRK